MPNSYTAVPNVIPGNLTVSGNLQVSGGRIEVGTIHPNLVIASDVNHIGYFGSNYDGSTGGRQNGGTAAFALVLDPVNNKALVRRYNSAGTSRDEALDTALFTDGAQHNNTGNTTENTIYLIASRANTLSIGSALRLRVLYFASVQGGVATTVRVYFGASVFAVFTFTATGTHVLEAIVPGDSTGNVTQPYAVDNFGTALAIQRTAISEALNADKNIKVTCQGGANTDNYFFISAYVEQIGSAAPTP